ncbi:MAG: hypothetical protein HOY78_02105 [Saccharothrix sp.]|nr:hypothetical protein [Saccharothrix sp.]
MKAAAVVLAVLGVLWFAVGEDFPTSDPYHETWTYLDSERGTDELGRDILVLLCERHGNVQRVEVKHGQDDTFADVSEGDPCPGTLDPTGPKP